MPQTPQAGAIHSISGRHSSCTILHRGAPPPQIAAHDRGAPADERDQKGTQAPSSQPLHGTAPPQLRVRDEVLRHARAIGGFPARPFLLLSCCGNSCAWCFVAPARGLSACAAVAPDSSTCDGAARFLASSASLSVLTLPATTRHAHHPARALSAAAQDMSPSPPGLLVVLTTALNTALNTRCRPSVARELDALPFAAALLDFPTSLRSFVPPAPLGLAPFCELNIAYPYPTPR
ncbi:hypothetical protein K458DRAFT_392160 [Lentithecium fluviatile CBS 122367]|uniref:Uncharacterized protein n=1 Tax=Lentithecium fluviatile CBS 122367 TaxID=1168545 RepID=A0A6G1ITE1_9PLEO|nr:hypothetical protein K458DRAFT_392160 [Lentithecium fluviatile CBS 122367]